MFAVGHILIFGSLHRLAGVHSLDSPSPQAYAVTSLPDTVGFAVLNDLEWGGSGARSGDMTEFPWAGDRIMVEGGVGPSTKLPSAMLRVFDRVEGFDQFTISKVAGEPASPVASTVALRAMEDKTQVKGHDPGKALEALLVYLKACSHGFMPDSLICE